MPQRTRHAASHTRHAAPHTAARALPHPQLARLQLHAPLPGSVPRHLPDQERARGHAMDLREHAAAQQPEGAACRPHAVRHVCLWAAGAARLMATPVRLLVCIKGWHAHTRACHAHTHVRARTHTPHARTHAGVHVPPALHEPGHHGRQHGHGARDTSHVHPAKGAGPYKRIGGAGVLPGVCAASGAHRRPARSHCSCGQTLLRHYACTHARTRAVPPRNR